VEVSSRRSGSDTGRNSRRKLTPEEIALSGQRAIFVRYQSLNQEANIVNVIIVYILRNGLLLTLIEVSLRLCRRTLEV
jgi:hypothetical protein